MLLNIDLPERHAMLHDKSCSHLPRPVSTRYKPVGSVGRDGGWFRIASKASAEAGYIYMYSLMEEQPLALAMQEELIAQVSAGRLLAWFERAEASDYVIARAEISRNGTRWTFDAEARRPSDARYQRFLLRRNPA